VRDGDGGGDGGDDGRGDGGGDGGGPASTTSAEGAASPAPSTTSTGGAVVALMLLLQLTSCRWLLGAVSAGEWLGVSEGFKCLLMADELPTPSPADYANFTIPKSIIIDYTWVAMESHVEMENLLRCFCVIVLVQVLAFQTALLVC
jgi:hypothetical protein